MAHSERRLHEVSTLTALSVLLDHPAVTSDHKNVCKLLHVCKAWRTAVQQSDTALTNIDTSISPRLEDLPNLAHLVAWISAYPSLIRTISIRRGPHSCNEQHITETCRRLLELGLRLAAAGTRQAARAMSLGAGLRPHQHWVLQSFKCDLESSPAMLAALPAATLTRLALSRINPMEMTAIAASIQGLPNLQELLVISDVGSSEQPSADHKLLAAVGTLQQLRILHLGCLRDMACLQQLPKQLQQLTLEVMSAPSIEIDLGHLTSLQHLEFNADCGIKSGSVLPANLTSLRLATDDEAPITAFGITNLQQLKFLSIGDHTMIELQAVASMSQLQQVHLLDQGMDCWGYTNYSEAWCQLSMLRSLGVRADCTIPGELIALCNSAGQATSITSLDLHLASEFLDLEDDEVEWADRLEPCLCLTRLTQLQDLSITMVLGDADASYMHLASHDLLHLTNLTGLTRLIVMAPGGADDTVVCALAGALTRLQCLSLPHYRLSTAPLPSLGLLKGLQHLALRSYRSGDAEFGLKFLTGLRGLTHLGGFEKAGQDALSSFWAAVHGQQQQ